MRTQIYRPFLHIKEPETPEGIYNIPCGLHHTHNSTKRRPCTMRPSNFIVAAMAGTARLVSAGTSTTDCTTTTTTASGYVWPTSWPSPTPNSTRSLSTLSETVTYMTDTSSASDPGITTYTSNTSSADATSTATVSTVSGSGATPADGLSGDRSVLGLVIFVALSLCLV